MARRGGTRHQAAVGFLFSFLRLRFASSLFAIRETLRRRLQRVQAAIDHLDLANVAESDDVDIEDIRNYPAPVFVNSQTDKANQLW
jgi:hypothetical protein